MNKMFHFVDSLRENGIFGGAHCAAAATQPSHGDVFHGSKAAGFQ
jgi:hypothetical protein